MDNNKKVDKIIFRPLSLDMNKKVKKVSDPPPRPMPKKLDTRQSDEWTPETRKEFDPEQLADGINKVGSIFKYVLFSTISLGVLAGVGYLVYWTMQQYNL